jgi:hypothetical protein
METASVETCSQADDDQGDVVDLTISGDAHLGQQSVGVR